MRCLVGGSAAPTKLQVEKHKQIIGNWGPARTQIKAEANTLSLSHLLDDEYDEHYDGRNRCENKREKIVPLADVHLRHLKGVGEVIRTHDWRAMGPRGCENRWGRGAGQRQSEKVKIMDSGTVERRYFKKGLITHKLKRP